MSSRIIVALDNIDVYQASVLVKKIKDYIWGVKINDMLLKHGRDAVTRFNDLGVHVFCDPKLYDIPNTVRNSVDVLINAGAKMITIHAEGGEEMMREAVGQAPASICKILAVTKLTSTKFASMRDRHKEVGRLALEAWQAGVHGVICAGDDVEFIDTLPFKLLKVVPGIRLPGMCKHDQVQTTDKQVGADYYVVGRPILQASDPVKSAQELNALLSF